jgi:NDP-sugar pyrophosphorylase family protein
MQAVILAGGLGTRLRPLTYAIPKPLVPIGNKPIVERLLDRLRIAGVRDAIMAVGYQGEMIEAYFREGSRVGLRLTYHSETTPLGTAGVLAALRARLTEPFLVLNGDILTGLDFADLYRFHVKADADATVAVREHQTQFPYGAVDLSEGRVERLREKPVIRQLINAGVYAFHPRLLQTMEPGARVDMPDLLAGPITAGRVAGYVFSDFWLDVGNLSDLERATAEVERWERDAGGRGGTPAVRTEELAP